MNDGMYIDVECNMERLALLVRLYIQRQSFLFLADEVKGSRISCDNTQVLFFSPLQGSGTEDIRELWIRRRKNAGRPPLRRGVR